MPDNIRQLLTDMYNRPGAYFGKKSLEKLAFSLSGYMLRDNELNGKTNDWFLGFQDFVTEYYKVEIERNWVDIINFFSCTEEDAFDNFYKLLELYIRTQGDGSVS